MPDLLPADTPDLRKARGAFFTPPAIAEYLAEWAVEDDSSASIMDPTCGEAAFLEAAGRKLAKLGATSEQLREQVVGVDLHEASVKASATLLRDQGLDGSFIVSDFFALPTPGKLDAKTPYIDAIIGNPPFVRYQRHVGQERKRAQLAALEQGVRLSGLASSWAALVVHACGFLKPEGRLAMVLPTELLYTTYAEPVRNWLKRRFKAVHLVTFERLQFADATEKVLLVLARGSGGCSAFSLVPVEDAQDLPRIRMFGPMHLNVAPPAQGKWTDLLLPVEHRQTYDRVVEEHLVPLSTYGSPVLGTVTGANDYFCISEATRIEYSINERHLMKISPPGTKHFRATTFGKRDWSQLRDAGAQVWLIQPRDEMAGWEEAPENAGLLTYLEGGISMKVNEAYKCRVRQSWYKPPAASPPDLFFTYMSHRYPRLITNVAGAGFVNSMHGITLGPDVPRLAKQALPFFMLSAATMLGAEIHGRSYGGGVLKMEPREAAELPVPRPEVLVEAWRRLKPERGKLERQLEQGLWTGVARKVDEALLVGACGIPASDVQQLHEAAQALRRTRIGRESGDESARGA
ncbi:MAG TPA: N-6 DNA methylase [Solirubrobacterales bacterium]|jgi:adenine-specific DNA methylase|nr:N-6 DNA methylase [Solirubrobacterales bacterium]